MSSIESKYWQPGVEAILRDATQFLNLLESQSVSGIEGIVDHSEIKLSFGQAKTLLRVLEYYSIVEKSEENYLLGFQWDVSTEAENFYQTKRRGKEESAFWKPELQSILRDICIFMIAPSNSSRDNPATPDHVLDWFGKVALA